MYANKNTPGMAARRQQKGELEGQHSATPPPPLSSSPRPIFFQRNRDIIIDIFSCPTILFIFHRHTKIAPRLDTMPATNTTFCRRAFRLKKIYTARFTSTEPTAATPPQLANISPPK